MQSKLLLDTSFLFALNDSTDSKHHQAVRFAARSRDVRVIAQVALPETAYMLETHAGEHALFRFWESLDSPDIQLEAVSKADLRRAREIRIQYADARFDFVDCCIMALSERLNITQVCTFDRRDFSIFRPSHTDYLELLP